MSEKTMLCSEYINHVEISKKRDTNVIQIQMSIPLKRIYKMNRIFKTYSSDTMYNF